MTMMGPSVLGRLALLCTWLVLCLINTWRGLPKSLRLARGSILAAAVMTCSTRQSSQLASWQAKKRAEVVWWWWRLS
ncbi:hypothetical protein HDV64DRAFT_243584 [Trichoderma sp. TUCIM 5745]